MSNYARITLAQIRTFLTSRVGDNSVFWSTQEKDDAFNHALQIWQALVGEFTKNNALTAATFGKFDVPSDVALPLRVQIQGGAELQLISVDELDKGIPNWRNSSGSAPTMWAPVGLNSFYTYPYTYAPVFLVVEGLSDDYPMTVAGEFAQLGDAEVQKLLSYAHHVLTWKEGGLELQATTGALAALIKAAAERKASIMETNYYRRYMGLNRDEVYPPDRTFGLRAL